MMIKKMAVLLLLSLCFFSCNREQTEQKEEEIKLPETSPYVSKLNQFKKMEMELDFTNLRPSEREVLHKLVLVAQILDQIYLKQVSIHNEAVRKEIEQGNDPYKADLLALFDLHFGPWDTLDENKPFYGEKEKPKGAGVYPEDMTKEEFNQWIADHPEDEEAFKSLYTVIVRTDDGGLKAVPYSEFYAEEIEQVAVLLEQAAAITEDDVLKKFLKLRAESFRTDQYRQSEMAWMDLNGNIEVAVGPYEVYTDELMGLKTFFETFITIRNPEESAKLDKYKGYLGDLERNLPLPDQHKNMNRGSQSPLAVVDQVLGGGDCKPAVQTIAFNLPNDEYVREKKGSKKVLLKNVMKAKFEAILEPMADFILDESQRALLDFEYFFLEVLFHEMSHGLGPGTIQKDGQQTTVSACLQETYSKIEEGKADIMGMYNIFFMMEKGEIPVQDKQKLMATYFAGLFRSMRFGIHEAHGGGAAFQYMYLKEKGAFSYDEKTGKFIIDFDVMEKATTDLLNEVLMIQAMGDYQASVDFLEKYAVYAPEVKATIAKTKQIPVDIKPIYPSL
ncbi:MAG: hypothetical protein CR997_06580 [Acidobacteria bacterium]|nr:MAG: hypothetical protein CR997_06580 [Acidobacteriota bacterium]